MSWIISLILDNISLMKLKEMETRWKKELPIEANGMVNANKRLERWKIKLKTYKSKKKLLQEQKYIEDLNQTK